MLLFVWERIINYILLDPSQVASASQASYGNVKFEIKIVRKYNMLLSFLSIVDI